jgi:hypothetical protein
MKELNLSNKSYFMAFFTVMLINLGLAIFLINNVMAQTSETSFKDQKPINVEVEEQKDCPIQLTVNYVDNSEELHQVINYTIQNTSKKSIKGFVILGGLKQNYKTITIFFPNKTIEPNTFSNGEFVEERVNIKENKILLSFDYVEFADGSSWGKDDKKQSENIKGGLAGAEYAVEKIRTFVERNNKEKLSDLFEKPLSDVEVSIPENLINKGENWQRGFINGYKGIISNLKIEIAKDNKSLSERLYELKYYFQFERGQR